jgi:hypothetical protein
MAFWVVYNFRTGKELLPSANDVQPVIEALRRMPEAPVEY